jgi:hypothetical protein
MGRPPLGKRAMTKTERQQRWRQGKRAEQSPHPDRDESRPPPAANQKLIERLTRERDEARRELALRLREVGEGRCFLCLKRSDEVDVMTEAPRSYFNLLLCNECIEGKYPQFLAELRRRRATEGASGKSGV